MPDPGDKRLSVPALQDVGDGLPALGGWAFAAQLVLSRDAGALPRRLVGAVVSPGQGQGLPE